MGLAIGGQALAQADIFSRDTLHGLAEVRLTAADGETGWLDRGFGKGFVGGGADGDWKARLKLSEASLEWKPRLNFTTSAVVTVQLQPDVKPELDIGEAYLAFRAPPARFGRVSARLGYFYPPISLEHEGVAWTNPDMLSSSAINSWVGEEVKVLGLEATWRREFGAHEVAATAALFDMNDTSGTLLSFRGWAMHGVKTGLSTNFFLPPLSAFMKTKQAPETNPYYQLDKRIGYYGRLEWRPPAPVVLQALYYDNVGNRIAVHRQQWAWETRFLSLAARWEPDERTTVAAQWMSGETLMGFNIPGGVWVDMGFRSAYLLGRRKIGEADTVSLRADWFDTTDRTFVAIDNNNEDGWALTAAWRHDLGPHATVLVEALHVSSQRPARALVREPADQDQTILQAALRLHF